MLPHAALPAAYPAAYIPARRHPHYLVAPPHMRTYVLNHYAGCPDRDSSGSLSPPSNPSTASFARRTLLLPKEAADADTLPVSTSLAAATPPPPPPSFPPPSSPLPLPLLVGFVRPRPITGVTLVAGWIRTMWEYKKTPAGASNNRQHVT